MEAAEIQEPVVVPVQPKFILSSRTILFNLASLALWAAQAVLQANILTPEHQVLVNIVGNGLLRLLTSTPVSFSPVKAE